MTTESDAQHALARANQQREQLRADDATPAARPPARPLSPEEAAEAQRFGIHEEDGAPAGWSFPAYLWRSHYFAAGAAWSICGRSHQIAPDQDRTPETRERRPDECHACLALMPTT